MQVKELMRTAVAKVSRVACPLETRIGQQCDSNSSAPTECRLLRPSNRSVFDISEIIRSHPRRDFSAVSPQPRVSAGLRCLQVARDEGGPHLASSLRRGGAGQSESRRGRRIVRAWGAVLVAPMWLCADIGP
jgi:hypothetical protein